MSDLIKSKRFWTALAGVAVVVVGQFFPNIPEDTVTNIVMMLSAWIIGETFRPVVQGPK